MKAGNSRVVIITGAYGGIGKACALELINQNYCVLAGVHTVEELELLRHEAPSGMFPILLDVTDERSMRSALKTAWEMIGEKGFAGLVNNAGVMSPGPLEFMSADILRHHFEVNAIGALSMVQIFIPLLRQHRARVVNLGSTSCFIPTVFQGPYCASKFALAAITDVLREELRASGVDVCMVVPGAVATPLWGKAIAAIEDLITKLPDESLNLYCAALSSRRRLFEDLQHSGFLPERVARVVCRALTDKRPQACYVIGLTAHLKLILSKLLPLRIMKLIKSLRQPGK